MQTDILFCGALTILTINTTFCSPYYYFSCLLKEFSTVRPILSTFLPIIYGQEAMDKNLCNQISRWGPTLVTSWLLPSQCEYRRDTSVPCRCFHLLSSGSRTSKSLFSYICQYFISLSEVTLVKQDCGTWYFVVAANMLAPAGDLPDNWDTALHLPEQVSAFAQYFLLFMRL